MHFCTLKSVAVKFVLAPIITGSQVSVESQGQTERSLWAVFSSYHLIRAVTEEVSVLSSLDIMVK